MSGAPEPQPSVVRELVLTGSPLALALPDLCARCGEAAAKRLYWQTVIQSQDSDGGYSIAVTGCQAPFCLHCLGQHESELQRMPWWKQALQCFRSELMIPAVLGGAAAAFFAVRLMPNPAKADWMDGLAFAGVVGFVGLISLLSLNGAWKSTRYYCVPPLTTITGSFTFGPDESAMFEGERHRYLLVNDAFFEALLAANREKVWKPGSAQAERASWKRTVLYVALGTGAAVLLLWDTIKPWVRVEW